MGFSEPEIAYYDDSPTAAAGSRNGRRQDAAISRTAAREDIAVQTRAVAAGPRRVEVHG